MGLDVSNVIIENLTLEVVVLIILGEKEMYILKQHSELHCLRLFSCWRKTIRMLDSYLNRIFLNIFVRNFTENYTFFTQKYKNTNFC